MNPALVIIKEEYERQLHLKELYRNKLEELPIGYIEEKKRGEQVYIYQCYRKNNKRFSIYIGNARYPETIQFQELMVKKKDLRNKLKKVNQYLSELKSVMKPIEKLLEKEIG